LGLEIATAWETSALALINSPDIILDIVLNPG